MFSKDKHKLTAHLQRKELNPEISLFTCSTQECQGILIAVNGWFELWSIVNMSSLVCPCTLLELHVGSPRQQPTGAISAHVMALTHKPSFGRSVSQKGTQTSPLGFYNNSAKNFIRYQIITRELWLISNRLKWDQKIAISIACRSIHLSSNFFFIN